VSGRLIVRKYTDKNGVERTTTEIVADDVQVFAKANGATHAPETSDSGDEFP
jgi:single-stranded DNA-binding protein